MSEIILLLTSTIDPGKAINTKLLDRSERQKQYVSSLEYYLKYFNYKIVFVDNSDINISDLFISPINQKRLEILSFYGMDYPLEYGKGFGEMGIINYAFTNSKFIKDDSVVVKITGRLKLLNIKNILDSISKKINHNKFVSTEFMIKMNACHSRLIVGSPSFFLHYLLNYYHNINDTKHYFFEHALADAIKQFLLDTNNKFIPLPQYALFEGFSGTSGIKYKTNFLFFIVRNLYTKIKGYLFFVLKQEI